MTTTMTPPAPAGNTLDIRRLARVVPGLEIDPRAILAGLSDTEAAEVAGAVVADLAAFPWPPTASGALRDESGACWHRVRGTLVGAKRERFDWFVRQFPKSDPHRSIRDIATVLHHAAAHRAELAGALADLDAALEVR